MEIGIQVMYAVIIALVYGLASYFKNHKIEEFNVPMLTKTLIIAVIVGAVTFYSGMTYDIALQFVVSNVVLMTFIDDIVNKLFKITPMAIVTAKRR